MLDMEMGNQEFRLTETSRRLLAPREPGARDGRAPGPLLQVTPKNGPPIGARRRPDLGVRLRLIVALLASRRCRGVLVSIFLVHDAPPTATQRATTDQPTAVRLVQGEPVGR
jgi:hypothetical protein